ncbi:hypothetical protein CRV03_02050 [Arcobacter sp. F155]|uniref:hypothetical protein n=1 Tax=Arcobacter sp. F155 TaxID=2044512 RepID=UPI00100BE34E|nr:hypothetical protein [Arcobacter sp. F155]RXJ78835.1 hypothetical protein CRV03_02050 [Arcobacter sp. F155]
MKTVVTILAALIILFIIGELNKYSESHQIIFGLLVSDIKNLLIGIDVGLFFSLLFTIKMVRNYILNSISNFMAHKSYIKRLDKKELITLKDEITEAIHGVDIVSNQESLFNSIKKLDNILTIPHKSIVNENWILSNYTSDNKYIVISRTQNFRIHKLIQIKKKDKENDFYNFQFRYSIKIDESDLEKMLDNFILNIQVEGQDLHSINKDNIKTYKLENGKFDNAYNKESRIYHFYFNCKIPLENEFTKIKVFTQRVEPKDDSIALVVTDATYCSNYTFNLPDNLKVNNVYTQETLIPSETKQVDIVNEDDNFSININGWQLPGLLFVITFNKD